MERRLAIAALGAGTRRTRHGFGIQSEPLVVVQSPGE